MKFHKNLRPLFKRVLRTFRVFLCVMGGIFIVAIILSFTDYPYWAYFWLGTHDAQLNVDPNVIVVLGGSGMPSSDGLMRTYVAAKVAHTYPDADIIIALPSDTAKHEKSPELLMAHELILRGIDSSRISYETKGNNTHSQAVNIHNMFGRKRADTICMSIVTSPENIYRSVRTFRKQGFCFVGGMAAFNEAIPEKLLIKKPKNKAQMENEIKQLNLRYNMWSYLKYEVTVLREYTAIVYYKIRGWM